jgi:aspartate aminotransferase
VVQRLQGMAGVECLPGDGTFYTFPRVQGLIEAVDGVSNDVELAEHLIEHAGVALVPGSAFGTPGHARLSIATSMENLTRALDRIAGVLG